MSDLIIPGLKLIHHTGGANLPDDPSFPWKLEINLSCPQLMDFSWILEYGDLEEIVVRSMTKEALDKFVDRNKYCAHPRLRHFTITGPDGVMERFSKPDGAIDSIIDRFSN